MGPDAGPGSDPAPGAQQANPYAPPSLGADAAPWAQPELAGSLPLAERGTRLGAALLDGLLMVGAMLPGVALVAVDETAMIVVMMLGILGLQIYQWYLITNTGQSLGKKWMGIRITMLDGSPVDFVHGVLLRSWVMGLLGQIPFAGGIIGLVDVLMIFGDERRCLHDHIASTKVVIAQY
nr:RDD family protein [Pseudenhygromyxa sp. WMMC2535]